MSRRAFFMAVLCAASVVVLSSRQKADASVFCEADVAAVAGVDSPAPLNSRVAHPRALIVLSTDVAETISGDVIVVTDTAAYDVPFSKLEATQPAAAETFLTQPLLISSVSPLGIRFAWVDQVGVNGAAPHTCPTNPLDASFETPDVPLPSDPSILARLQTVPATFKMNLPPTDCSEPYKPAKMTEHPDENTEFWDTSAGLKTKLALRAYLTSAGKVVYVKVIRSSGSTIVDDAGKDGAARAKYSPAIFRCIPIVGTVDIDFSYEIRP